MIRLNEPPPDEILNLVKPWNCYKIQTKSKLSCSPWSCRSNKNSHFSICSLGGWGHNQKPLHLTYRWRCDTAKVDLKCNQRLELYMNKPNPIRFLLLCCTSTTCSPWQPLASLLRCRIKGCHRFFFVLFNENCHVMQEQYCSMAVPPPYCFPQTHASKRHKDVTCCLCVKTALHTQRGGNRLLEANKIRACKFTKVSKRKRRLVHAWVGISPARIFAIRIARLKF